MFKAWVKNVYSLCVEGVLNGVYTYTPFTPHYQLPSHQSAQPIKNALFINRFTPASYTPISSQLHLIYTHLYTLPTAPIIKKNKKK